MSTAQISRCDERTNPAENNWDSGPDRPFAKLADATLWQFAAAARQCSSSIDTLVGDFANQGVDHHVTSTNGKFQLWAKQIKLNEGVQHRLTCRMVLIQGQKNEILNTWIFPTAPENCPVFAAELIAMACMPRLSFIDIQSPAMTCGTDKVRSLTHQLRARHAELVCDEEPPEWATDASEGGYVFSRALPSTAFDRIDTCYQDYLRCYLGEFFLGEPVSVSDVDGRSTAVRELSHYQIHHMEHSPGSVFLGKLFGDEWTNDFLRNFLFASA
jgi:hypothetical protein